MTNLALEERSLAERLKSRVEVEQRFARQGYTDRHGRLNRAVERKIERPLLKFGLKALGLYEHGRQNSLRVATTRLQLAFPDLPTAFEGFQILHISDFHIDGVDGLTEVLERELPGLRPDLCVFTGDYRFEDSGDCTEVYPRMRRVIRSIHAKQGIYAILGNHDAAEMVSILDESGARMLLNDAVEIEQAGESFWLLGVDDSFDYRCDDLPAALATVPPGAFKILLSHSPELYRDAAASRVQLYLTGHTHAGQIRIPGIGALKHNARCPRSIASGLWKYGGMQGYTSNGVGCSGVPVRFYCPPEIVLIELRRETSE